MTKEDIVNAKMAEHEKEVIDFIDNYDELWKKAVDEWNSSKGLQIGEDEYRMMENICGLFDCPLTKGIKTNYNSAVFIEHRDKDDVSLDVLHFKLLLCTKEDRQNLIDFQSRLSLRFKPTLRPVIEFQGYNREIYSIGPFAWDTNSLEYKQFLYLSDCFVELIVRK